MTPSPPWPHAVLAGTPSWAAPAPAAPTGSAAMGALVLPAPDSPMSVPVRAPSGEAYVEVADDEGGHRQFWMLYEDGRWLVGGELR